MDSVQEVQHDGVKFQVMDSEHTKILQSPNYNFTFRKEDGYFERCGATEAEDPLFSPIGPEILDIEISVDGCPNNCSFCLPPGAKVNIPNGTKDVDDIKVGDSVIGFDFGTGRIREQRVEETYSRHFDGELIIIELSDGRVVELTEDHEVMLGDGSQKKARDLTEKDDVIIL